VFNVGLGELAAILVVCLLVFGPQRLPEMARQTGRLLGQLRLVAQDALDQVKQEADLQDADLPDLRVASLRGQARDYVGQLLDIDGQMAELQRARAAIKTDMADINQPESKGPTVAAQAQDRDPPPVDPEAT
jgi:sec-independent protein translocase protein TatB